MMMKSDKADRRVKYTKMVLQDSLVGLLKQKPITKISIKEICEAADINRSTFYAHYVDQYDLFNQIQQAFFNEINEYLRDYNIKEYEAESLQTMQRIFDYITENAELCKVMLGEHGDIELQKQVMMIVQRQCMKEWQGVNQIDGEMMEYLYLFATNGSIGIVQQWLQSGMKKSTREMAELVIKLAYRGYSAFI